jgi:hypothetical protein
VRIIKVIVFGAGTNIVMDDGMLDPIYISWEKDIIFFIHVVIRFFPCHTNGCDSKFP